MTYNDAITKYNIISNIVLTDGDSELPKELKVKIVRNRIKLNKIKKEWDECMGEAIEQFKTEEYHTLIAKENRNDKEQKKLEKIVDKINAEFNEFVENKAQEELDINIDSFNSAEFDEIIAINASHTAVINGKEIDGITLMEFFSDNFVNE
jgi:hypothetical protein